MADGARTPQGVSAPFFVGFKEGFVRATLTRIVAQLTASSRPSGSRYELDIPFPLMLDTPGSTRNMPQYSTTERAFCEGSVMIW
jgi:hypothetical protein